MTLRQVKISVKSFNGQCDTLCGECSTTRGVVDRSYTLDNSGVLYGQVVPRESDLSTIWIQGDECFVNFEYDDAQLAPGIVLKSCDICLACGCMVDLIDRGGFTIEDEAGNSAFIGQFEHILFTGTNLATVTVTDAEPTVVDINVPCSEVRTCFSELDTPSVDYHYDPVTGVHSADVKLSATPGNQLVILPDGLFLPSDSLVNNANNTFTHTDVDGNAVTVNYAHTLAATGGSILSFTQPNGTVTNIDLCPVVALCDTPDTPITPIDTPTVNLTVSGLDNHTLQADVNVSATPGNAISILPDGLFVGAPAVGTLTDNGDRTFTYNNGVNPPTVFCQGIQTLNTGGGCDTVGGNNMVRSATLAGCTLTITSAPEHTSISVEGQGGQPGGGSLAAVGATRVATTAFLVNNPSACRSMALRIGNLARSYGVTLTQAVRMHLTNEIDNGTGFNGYNYRQSYGTPPFANAQNDLMTNFERVATLAPGAAVNLQFRTTILLNGRTAPGTYLFDSPSSVSNNFWVFGSTI